MIPKKEIVADGHPTHKWLGFSACDHRQTSFIESFSETASRMEKSPVHADV